jgi:hypothetical protein
VTRLRSDDGIGLVDALVGIALAAILMLGIAGVARSAYAATRSAGEAVKGDEDVQLLASYLTRDVHAAVADPQLTSVSGGGATLRLGVVDVNTPRFSTVTYAYDAGAGTITRTVTAAGQTPVILVVARSLEPSYAPLFEYCSPIALTITPAITASGSAQAVGVSTTANVKAGIELTMGTGASAETVVVTDVGVGTLTAVFSKAHVAGTSASNACLSVAANVPFRVNGNLIVRTLRASLHLRASP